jgi:hypothetical protein
VLRPAVPVGEWQDQDSGDDPNAAVEGMLEFDWFSVFRVVQIVVVEHLGILW